MNYWFIYLAHKRILFDYDVKEKYIKYFFYFIYSFKEDITKDIQLKIITHISSAKKLSIDIDLFSLYTYNKI